MSLASGEYIAFVDSDDYVKSEMYKILYEAAKKENADIAMCGLCCIGGIMSAKENDVQNINCFDDYTVFAARRASTALCSTFRVPFRVRIRTANTDLAA